MPSGHRAHFARVSHTRVARALGCAALAAIGACGFTSLDPYFACPQANPHCQDSASGGSVAEAGSGAGGAMTGSAGLGGSTLGGNAGISGADAGGTSNEAGVSADAGAAGAAPISCTTSADCHGATCSRGVCGPAFTLTYLDTPDKDTDETAAKWIKFAVQINNRTGASVPLADFTVRYYFTPEGNDACCMSQVLSTAPPPSDVSDVSGMFDKTDNGWSYLETGFDSTAGKIGADSSSGQVQMGIHNAAFSAVLNVKNDYSWNDVSHITLYQNGALVWGTEPAAPPVH